MNSYETLRVARNNEIERISNELTKIEDRKVVVETIINQTMNIRGSIDKLNYEGIEANKDIIDKNTKELEYLNKLSEEGITNAAKEELIIMEGDMRVEYDKMVATTKAKMLKLIINMENEASKLAADEMKYNELFKDIRYLTDTKIPQEYNVGDYLNYKVGKSEIFRLKRFLE